MTTKHGFTLVRTEDIPEINAKALQYRHDRTGADLLSIVIADENKVFGISFRTPANDSTGVAHILEHSVLCGSRKYPTKEPFVELLKGSLQTFLNAFTYPDKTCYPVASQNVKDFYNLIDVYLDAVFHPNLTRHTHEQEGWHYEIEKLDQPLIYKGIVFNEMKGVYSSPESILAEAAQQSLFPGTPYGIDSGGHPWNIPDLTWEQLVAFHRRYYHPSNAYIFFYGDDDPDTRLKIMDEALREYDRLDIASSVPLPQPFSEPRAFTKFYPAAAGKPAAAGDEEESRSFHVVNWLLAETTDILTSLGLGLLDHILIGTPAAPLRKALIDSGLGEDLAGIGLEGQLRQMYFSTGLKGIDPKDAPAVEQLIFDTLRGLVKNGIDPRTIEATINTIEFRLRENNTGNFPRGLSLMVRALTTWLYEGDPLDPIRFEKPLADIKARAGARYFESLIQRYLLDNPHRTSLTLKPDPDLGKKEEERERARLAEDKSRISNQQINELIANTEELKRLQALPDTPEDLAKIPSLKRGDLDKFNRTIPIDVTNVTGAKVIYHDLFTQGIVYLDVGFDLHTLPQRLLPYVGVFGTALLETGTAKEDFVSLGQRIGSRTGGIEPHTYSSMICDTREGTAWLFLRGKAMARGARDLLDILADVVSGARLDNQERIKQIVLEEKASVEAELTPSGHRVVAARLRSRLNEADWAAEQMGGVEYLFFVRKLAEELNHGWTRIHTDLEELRQILLNRSSMIINVTTDAATWQAVEPMLRDFIDHLPQRESPRETWPASVAHATEGLSIPTKVNFVGQGADLYSLGYTFHGSALVVSRYLRSAWLWERVRVQGGAYGGFCSLDPRSGAFVYLSYRDPNVATTLNVYNQTAAYLSTSKLSDEEVTKAIIGAIGDLDAYQLPDAKGFTSMTRLLAGDTDDKRQKLRDEVLATTGSHFNEFANALDLVRIHPTVVVLGSEEAITAAGIAPVTRVM
ncbi:MAG: insulinase family protein [bacterium]